MTKQYWADAITMNCVWLFQVILDDGEVVTERVFLTQEEAKEYGKARPYAWGKENEGWKIYGVPCDGLMAEILGKHTEEFKNKVDMITEKC